MLLRNVMIHPVDAALHDREKTPNSVRMGIAANVFAYPVIDCFVIA
jgi:hypothetical protein